MDILEQSLETCSSQDDVQLKSEEADDPTPMNPDLTIIEDEGSISDDQGVGLGNVQAVLDNEDDVQFQWKSDNGVTYRVFQVNHEDQEGETVGSDFQASSTHIQPVTAVLSSNLASNHFYVVGNDILTTPAQRSLAQRSNVVIENRAVTVPANPTRVRRDDRRRATHNEVERRRRDKINNWIMKLSKIIPDCNSVDNCKNVQSKGGILAKACEYIVELRNSSQRLADSLKENERLTSLVEFLQEQNVKLKLENSMLRQKNNIVAVERRVEPES